MAKSKTQTKEKPQEREGAFIVHTPDQGLIEDNASDHFSLYGDMEARREFIKEGFIAVDGHSVKISEHGWKQLEKDSFKLESNAITWLKATFNHVRDDGHDSRGDLVGSFWWNPASESQLEQLEVGLRERIDMSDSSYGSLANVSWKGISSFGQHVLSGGTVNFEHVDLDEVEDLLEAFKSKKGKR